MRDFKTYAKAADEVMEKFRKTHNMELDAEDILAYSILISELASTIKGTENLKLVLQETTDHETGNIEFRSKVSLRNLYDMAALVSGAMNPQDISKKDLIKYAMRGDSGYADLRLKMVYDVLENEKLIKTTDVPVS